MRSYDMGLVRVALVALVLLPAFAAPIRADDYGPRRGVREVRAAVPALVHRTMRELFLGSPIVDDAIVGSDNAIVDFHGDRGRGIAALTYKNATWWLVGSVFEQQRAGWSWWTGDSPAAPWSCRTTTKTAPTAAYLRDALGADAATVALWTAHGRDPRDVVLPFSPIRGSDMPQACATGAIYIVNGHTSVANDAGYRVSWTSPEAFGLANVHGRAPDDAEMSGPGANSIFYIYANGGPVALSAPKSTLSIWCPFVLDTGVHYIIEFSGADGRLGPIRATLNDNTLTFEIPAFTAPAKADLRGEVDYLPYRKR